MKTAKKRFGHNAHKTKNKRQRCLGDWAGVDGDHLRGGGFVSLAPGGGDTKATKGHERRGFEGVFVNASFSVFVSCELMNLKVCG